jgi:hypothetical protein
MVKCRGSSKAGPNNERYVGHHNGSHIPERELSHMSFVLNTSGMLMFSTIYHIIDPEKVNVL